MADSMDSALLLDLLKEVRNEMRDQRALLLESRGPQSPEVLDQISDLYLACDSEWRLTLLNASAREYLRRAGQEPGGLHRIRCSNDPCDCDEVILI